MVYLHAGTIQNNLGHGHCYIKGPYTQNYSDKNRTLQHTN